MGLGYVKTVLKEVGSESRQPPGKPDEADGGEQRGRVVQIKFDLDIYLSAAKTLNLAISPNLLARGPDCGLGCSSSPFLPPRLSEYGDTPAQLRVPVMRSDYFLWLDGDAAMETRFRGYAPH
jgi:hypothetical protein